VADRVHPLKLCSLLLQYPSDELRTAAGEVGEFAIAPARKRQAERLREFCCWYAATPLSQLQRGYVDAFDFDKRSSLHLTYHVHGDRRQRGVAMLELKRAYRSLGFEPPADELPDFLPLMLEFASLAPTAEAQGMLEEHRVALELVRAGLKRADSEFRVLLEVILDSLGRLSAHKLSRVRRLAESGPPAEEVGLEPFAPPEVMPGEDRGTARPLVGGWEAR